MVDSVPGLFQVVSHVQDSLNNVLYLGGEIRQVNDINYRGIVKYNGVKFDTLQSGLNDNANTSMLKSLQMFQNKLYAFGSFYKTGKHWCKYIGRWSGSSWDTVNFKPNQPVWWSDVYNNELYVSGWFDTIAGLPIKHVAKFDGTNWHDLSFPYADRAETIKNYKGKLYAASYTGLWQYSNNTWTHLADCNGDIYRAVFGMAVIDSLLYIYGRFNSLGGVTSKGIVAFDGVKWYGLGQGMSYTGYEVIRNVQKIDGKIYITGNFDKIEGISTSSFVAPSNQNTNYAVLENNQWCLKSGPFDNASCGVVKYNNEHFIYGAFRKCGPDTIFGFAKWIGGNSTVTCSNTFSISHTYVGLKEEIFFAGLKVYPNPFTNKITISAQNFDQKNIQLEIINSIGQLVYTQSSLNDQNEIYLTYLSTGLYFLKFKSESTQAIFKLIKE